MRVRVCGKGGGGNIQREGELLHGGICEGEEEANFSLSPSCESVKWHSRGCVIFPQNRATYKQRFSSTVDELLGIFEWKCGGGLADGGNRLHSCAASGRAGHTAYIHTQSFTTHSDVLWGTPKSSIKQLIFCAPVLNELMRQKV